jgi:hypothetical protein
MRDDDYYADEEAEEILIRLSSADLIDQAEPVCVAPRIAGTSLRLSVPLLRQLDILAKAQHRTRSNLIQYILWEYIRTRRPQRSAEHGQEESGGDMRDSLSAYYYGFTSTSDQKVDAILQAVAHASKMYHNTADWDTATVAAIQDAANQAAIAAISMRALAGNFLHQGRITAYLEKMTAHLENWKSQAEASSQANHERWRNAEEKLAIVRRSAQCEDHDEDKDWCGQCTMARRIRMSLDDNTEAADG